MKVLKNETQISDARQDLIKMGVSGLATPLRSLLRRFSLINEIVLGDQVKSWDVLETLEFINRHTSKNAPILDIGCYASEILIALHKLGYKNLTGADLNPDLKKMPSQREIRYEVTNFMQTPFVDNSFEVITSISVIEHGFDGHALLKEMSRLLKPGGYFISSFDYWPEKIDTTGTKFFGMDWMIFSKQDVENLITLALDYGFAPFGELNYEAEEAPIECGGKKYSFGWLVLQKSV